MNSNNKIDLMKMTSDERIKYHKDNWTKPFGNYEKFFHMVPEQEVLMEFVAKLDGGRRLIRYTKNNKRYILLKGKKKYI
jgi:hypothetical protein